MQMNTCCYKALKHGETECPVCGQTLLPFNIVIQTKIDFDKGKRR